jgi:hypothetical protein
MKDYNARALPGEISCLEQGCMIELIGSMQCGAVRTVAEAKKFLVEDCGIDAELATLYLADVSEAEVSQPLLGQTTRQYKPEPKREMTGPLAELAKRLYPSLR